MVNHPHDDTPPFPHLDPTLWAQTKVAHVTLTVVGTLLLAPAALVLLVFWEVMNSTHGSILGDHDGLAITTAMIGTVSGGFAWCALCLLYFKRNDLRWQRAAWSACALFGYLTTPCIIGWIVWIANEAPEAGETIAIFLGIFAASVSCMVAGHKNAAAARKSLKQALR